jgi:hypothetical protein
MSIQLTVISEIEKIAAQHQKKLAPPPRHSRSFAPLLKIIEKRSDSCTYLLHRSRPFAEIHVENVSRNVSTGDSPLGPDQPADGTQSR